MAERTLLSRVLAAIRAGEDVRSIVSTWQWDGFQARRVRHLLY